MKSVWYDTSSKREPKKTFNWNHMVENLYCEKHCLGLWCCSKQKNIRNNDLVQLSTIPNKQINTDDIAPESKVKDSWSLNSKYICPKTIYVYALATTPQMLSSTLVFLINGQGIFSIVFVWVVKKLDINKCKGWKKIPYCKKLILSFALTPSSNDSADPWNVKIW